MNHGSFKPTPEPEEGDEHAAIKIGMAVGTVLAMFFSIHALYQADWRSLVAGLIALASCTIIGAIVSS